jgi:hypothetical protein
MWLSGTQISLALALLVAADVPTPAHAAVTAHAALRGGWWQ